jgi:hypothetical protein
VSQVLVFVITHRGPEIELFEECRLTRPTRRQDPSRHVLEELRTAYLAGLARRLR